VLLALKDGDLLRFRCHTGHAFSVDSLLAALTATIEDQLWSSVRSLEESLLLLNQLGDHFAEAQQTRLAAVYYQHANAANAQAQLVRQALAQRELLSKDRLQQQADALQNNEGTAHGESH
jgi:two-component system chemotaxis response regulator CheB